MASLTPLQVLRGIGRRDQLLLTLVALAAFAAEANSSGVPDRAKPVAGPHGTVELISDQASIQPGRVFLLGYVPPGFKHLYGAKTTPHMFIINPQGVLIYDGAIDNRPTPNPADIAVSTNYLSQALDEAMAGKPVSVPVSRPYGCSVKYAH